MRFIFYILGLLVSASKYSEYFENEPIPVRVLGSTTCNSIAIIVAISFAADTIGKAFLEFSELLIIKFFA